MKVKNSFKEKKNVQMNFLNPEQIDWQPNLSIKDKKLQLNQHNVEKKDCSTNVNIRKKILKMDQQTILDKRDWQTSINIRMRKMYIVQLLLMKSENFMLLSRVHLLFINQLWYKHSVITAENLRLSNPTVEKYLLC